MRPEHIQVFRTVAQRYECWIGLREPNPFADRWVGRPGCIPKSEGCKAKTADKPGFALAGLVVDPTARPDAFLPGSWSEALRKWRGAFLKGGRVPVGYAVVGEGAERGLLRYHGNALYADYDLMAIVRSDPTGARIHTTPAEQEALFPTVRDALNRGLGVALIQHGAEFMWREGLGARESEWVLWFGPGGRAERHPSSMPQAGH